MIEVNNLTKDRIADGFLKNIARKVLAKEPASLQKKAQDLSIALVKKEEIRKLNVKYRQKDKPTDVLSFSYGSSGEVVICPDIVKENAKKYRNVFKEELARVLIHGILHILGYNHREMADKPARYIKIFLK